MSIILLFPRNLNVCSLAMSSMAPNPFTEAFPFTPFSLVLVALTRQSLGMSPVTMVGTWGQHPMHWLGLPTLYNIYRVGKWLKKICSDGAILPWLMVERSNGKEYVLIILSLRGLFSKMNCFTRMFVTVTSRHYLQNSYNRIIVRTFPARDSRCAVMWLPFKPRIQSVSL